jgi:hypothetical protein
VLGDGRCRTFSDDDDTTGLAFLFLELLGELSVLYLEKDVDEKGGDAPDAVRELDVGGVVGKCFQFEPASSRTITREICWGDKGELLGQTLDEPGHWHSTFTAVEVRHEIAPEDLELPYEIVEE